MPASNRKSDHPRARRAQHRGRHCSRSPRRCPRTPQRRHRRDAVRPRGEGRGRFRRSRPQGRRSCGHRQAGAVRHQARRAPTPAMATSAGAPASGLGEGQAFAVDAFCEKPDAKTAAEVPRRRATISGTAASSFSTPTHSSTRSRASSRKFSKPPARRSHAPPTTWASCASTGTTFAESPEHLRRLRRHGENQGRRHAADRCRLERRRLLVVALGNRAARRSRQLRPRRQRAGRHIRLLRPLRTRSRRDHRRRRSHHRRHARRAARRRQGPRAGRRQDRRHA